MIHVPEFFTLRKINKPRREKSEAYLISRKQDSGCARDSSLESTIRKSRKKALVSQRKNTRFSLWQRDSLACSRAGVTRTFDIMIYIIGRRPTLSERILRACSTVVLYFFCGCTLPYCVFLLVSGKWHGSTIISSVASITFAHSQIRTFLFVILFNLETEEVIQILQLILTVFGRVRNWMQISFRGRLTFRSIIYAMTHYVDWNVHKIFSPDLITFIEA